MPISTASDRHAHLASTGPGSLALATVQGSTGFTAAPTASARCHDANSLPPRPAHPVAGTLPPGAAGLRPRRPGMPASDLTNLPREMLQRIGAHLPARPDRTHLAMAAPSLRAALQPQAPGQRMESLREMAQSVNDTESLRLMLRESASLPSAPHVTLVQDLIGRLADIGTADGTFGGMQAAAPIAAQAYRLLDEHIAALPSAQRAGLYAHLAPHLECLPHEERQPAMARLLAQTRQQPAHEHGLETLKSLALRISQFNHLELPEVVQALAAETANLPMPQRLEVAEELACGLQSCKVLHSDRERIQQVITELSTTHATF